MIKKTYLGGGCFWGMQDLFREQPGVVDTKVGYSGGKHPNPTYESHAGHAEALEVSYDTEQTSLEEILDFFFRIHNPTMLNQQGNDIGSSYRSVIFYQDEEEKELGSNFINKVDQSGKWADPVVTSLEPFQKLYLAEAYHQDYLIKNPGGYTCHFVRFDSY